MSALASVDQHLVAFIFGQTIINVVLIVWLVRVNLQCGLLKIDVACNHDICSNNHRHAVRLATTGKVHHSRVTIEDDEDTPPSA